MTRERRIWLLAGAGVLAAVIVAVAIAVSQGGADDEEPSPAPGSGGGQEQTEDVFEGIPQSGVSLGDPDAPATLIEFADLQCPFCAEYSRDVLPTLIDRYVRTGKLKVEARPVAIIGDGVDSNRGRLGMIAAEQQNRGFNFAQLLYFNQGPEDGGWLDDTMIASAAKSIPGVNVKELVDAAKSSSVAARARTYDQQASADGLTGTPYVLVGKTGGKPTAVTPGSMPDVAAMTSAINGALQ